MAKSVSKSVSTFFGDIRIYADKTQQLKAERLIKKIPSILNNGYSRGSKNFGNKLLRIIKKSLSTGVPPPGSNVSWAPHSASTIKQFGEHTLLNYTGQYKRSVKLMETKSRIYVGLPRVKKVSAKSGKNTKRTLNQVAIMLEYGSRDGNLPARPLWAPAYKAVGGKPALKKEIRNELRKEIRKYTKK